MQMIKEALLAMNEKGQPLRNRQVHWREAQIRFTGEFQENPRPPIEELHRQRKARQNQGFVQAIRCRKEG